jgi:hypothetical protein
LRPAGTRFRKLGSHRFRGLREPQALFQAEASDLPTHFPPLRTLAVPRGDAENR